MAGIKKGSVKPYKQTVALLWNIPDWGHLIMKTGEWIESPVFDGGQVGEKWYLKCYPSGHDASSSGWVSWCLINAACWDVTASYKLLLVSEDAEEEEDYEEVDVGNDVVFAAGDGPICITITQEEATLTIRGDLIVLVEVTTTREGNELLKKMTSDLANLLRSGDHSDLIVKAGDEAFKVHRNILASRSDYFKMLLSSDMKEAKDGLVEIKEFSKETVRAVLSYLYQAELPGPDVVEEFIVAVDKYGFPELKPHCTSLLSTSITIENICRRLPLADLLDMTELKESCLKFIWQNWEQVIKSEEFDMIAGHKDLRKAILERVCPKPRGAERYEVSGSSDSDSVKRNADGCPLCAECRVLRHNNTFNFS